MSAAFTQGPWKVRDGTWIVASGDLHVAEIDPFSDMGSAAIEACARLIASAPKLHAAALALYVAGRWSCDRPADEAQLWADLRDALGLPPGSATALGVSDGARSEPSTDASNKPGVNE